MNMLKKAAVVAMVAGSVLGTGAGVALAHDADGKARNSPGVVSGNVVQVPVEVDANVCGSTVNVVGLLDPAAGNLCVNK